MFALALLIPVRGNWHAALIAFAVLCAVLFVCSFFVRPRRHGGGDEIAPLSKPPAYRGRGKSALTMRDSARVHSADVDDESTVTMQDRAEIGSPHVGIPANIQVPLVDDSSTAIPGGKEAIDLEAGVRSNEESGSPVVPRDQRPDSRSPRGRFLFAFVSRRVPKRSRSWK